MRKIKLFIIAALCTAALITGASAAHTATISADSGLRLRTAASSSAETLLIAPKGAEVTVVETQNGWSQVYYPSNGLFGWMSNEYLTTKADSECELEIAATVTGSVVNLRSEPSTSASVLDKLSKGTSVTITGISGDWFAVKHGDKSGWMFAEYVAVATTAAAKGTAYAADTTSVPPTSDSISELRQELIDFAKQYIGTPYKSGGKGPGGFDCSGFVYYVFKNFGYTLNPGASRQMNEVPLIKKAELIPGDLVFFNNGSGQRASHVGIYIGDNSFIHATSPGKPLAIDSLGSNYYTKYYVGAGRVLPVE